mgnify:CR=1 FL=1
MQVILSLAFADVNANTAAIYVLNNVQLQKTSIAGPLQDLTTIHVAFNARLKALEMEMPPNSSLETLILSDNNLTTVSPEWFINTPNLTEISLANNGLCKYALLDVCFIQAEEFPLHIQSPLLISGGAMIV